MKNRIVKILILVMILVSVFYNVSQAYWIWTPGSKKFINPKYAVKDSPKEQYDWAMSFYNTKNYQRAASEFEKLVKNYEYSEYASRAQYHVGLSYENMGKYYIAFQNYQKAVENFPHIENMDEVIAREFNIGNLYMAKTNPSIMGTGIMTSLDRSVEIYKKVVDNAPYGKLADEAQFRLGEALKKSDRYDEAIEAYQKVVDDYPNSKFFDKAKYEVAYCAYKASSKPDYDVASTDKAIKAFEDFAAFNKDNELTKEADSTVRRLKDKAAEKSFVTAKFYESRKQYKAALMYYQDVVNSYPDSSFANPAEIKLKELNKKIEHSAKK